MHTVRNRKASRPPVVSMSKIPATRALPVPAFPMDLTVPPRRGAVITATPWPAVTPKKEVATVSPSARPQPPRGKRAKRRARKAAHGPAHIPALAPALTLPSVLEPLVEPVILSPCDDPLDTVLPLPRARSLVPTRRQGLVDVVAYILRDSGRRLARWSARRHKSREDKAEMIRAEREWRSLQLQLEALAALREFARAE